ncbi:MAG: 1-acyl-sn-glycerol-3-phosphate acyltransferase [Verrucomicrobiota bacterium]|jgi:1-acyl-sn-glycerol-3-phosphate acyltransferase
MQNIVIDQPYRFVPPHRDRFWYALFGLWLPRYLNRSHGIESVECRGVEHLRRSLDAGHGILLTSNHCRPCDPMTLGMLSLAVRRPFYMMASWHLFRQSRFQTWLLPRIGAFSVYREGLDREALKTAVGILNEAERPLLLFPEGVVSRTNDRLNNLMEGTAFIAHTAAKQRATATPPGQVVIHPVVVRYLFRGDLEAALTPVIEEIEARFSWRPPPGCRLRERINRVGEALLCLKELEYLGQPQTGDVPERLGRLINCLLQPLEKEWLKGEGDGDVVARVKKLRMAILPDLISGEIDEAERARRWRELADLDLAQQLSCYPPDYIRSRPTAERLLETVERFEEDLTDRTRIHQPLHAIIEVGEALPVSPVRERGGGPDPLMEKIRGQLVAMLERSGKETTPLAENSP